MCATYANLHDVAVHQCAKHHGFQSSCVVAGMQFLHVCLFSGCCTPAKSVVNGLILASDVNSSVRS